MPGQDANTRFLSHFNGSDEATSTTDETGRHSTITFNGTAQLDTAQKKFGTASLLLDGNSDYLTIPASADWDVWANASGDYIMDCWIRTPDNYSGRLISQYPSDTNNDWMLYVMNGSLALNIKDGGSNPVDTGGQGSFSSNIWTHIAMCKVGNDHGMYIGGSQIWYQDWSGTVDWNTELIIGRRVNGSSYFDGHIDEFRMQQSNIFGASPVVGLTDTITVPTSEYSTSIIVPSNQSIIII